MKLLEKLPARGDFRCAVFMTHNLNLAWFESYVYPQLVGYGIRRILILADKHELSATMARKQDRGFRAGIDYSVVGMEMKGCFHPKAILVSGRAAARLYVGSGNLTSNGFGRNREIFEMWECDSKDAEVSPVFEKFRQYLDTLLVSQDIQYPAYVRDTIDHAFGTQLLAKPIAQEERTHLVGSPGGLFSKLPAIEGKAVKMTLLAPYFDKDGRMARDLAAHFNCSSFDVVTDGQATNLCAQAAKNIVAAGGRVFVIEEEKYRRLHAKAFVVTGDSILIGGSGSANMSVAAWRGHNAELITLREGEAAQQISELLDQLPLRELDPEEIEQLGAYKPPPEDTEAFDKSPLAIQIHSAAWSSQDTVKIQMSSPIEPANLEFEFLGRGRSGKQSNPKISDEPNVCFVSVPSFLPRGHHCCVRVRMGDDTGHWTVVADQRSLREHASFSRRLDKLATDLLSEIAGAQASRRLLMLLGDMYKSRLDSKSTGGETDASNGDMEDTPTKVTWAWVKEEDFQVSEFEDDDTPLFSRTGGSTRLINVLLFGSEKESTADEDEGESELDEEGLPNVGQGQRSDTTRAPRKVKSLDEIVADVVSRYIRQLKAGMKDEIGFGRLVEDMQVLCASIHAAFAQGSLSRIEYKKAIRDILVEFVGGSNAALIVALKQIPEEEAIDTWNSSALVTTIGILFYNYAVSFAQEEGPDETELLLWFQHIYPLIPEQVREESLASIDRRIPLLRRGVFWMERQWGATLAAYPYKGFLLKLMDAANVFMKVRAVIPEFSPTGVEKDDVEENEVLVVQRHSNGFLRVGFAEGNEDANGNIRSVKIWLRAHPFDTPEPDLDSHQLPRLSVLEAQVSILEQILDHVATNGQKDLEDGKEILKRLAHG